MRRMSSPGAYSLCSENSIDAPACGFWCMPANAPSTITRARTLIDPRRAMSIGIERQRAAFAASVRRPYGRIASTSPSTSACAVRPSASAWKFGSTRWTSTGGASARTSSIDAA